MDQKNWIETEREYEFNDKGEMLPKKSKYVQARFSPRKRELIDFCLRLIGSISILVPLLLLFFQRRNEIGKENRLALTAVYTDFAKDVQIWNNAWRDSGNALSKIDSIYSAYIPKMNVYGSDALSNAFTGTYQSAYIRTGLRRYFLELYQILDSVDGYYDSINSDSTFTIESTDFIRDTAKLFQPLYSLYVKSLDLSAKRIEIQMFVQRESSRYSLDTLGQNSVLNAMDSLEEQLSLLTLVPENSMNIFTQLKQRGADPFVFPVRELGKLFEDKLFKCYNSLIEADRKNDEQYWKEIKRFQVKLLNAIK